jgi:hypothetical protein
MEMETEDDIVAEENGDASPTATVDLVTGGIQSATIMDTEISTTELNHTNVVL